MEIRRAVASDAASVCQVLRRSIEDLCTADHRNDPTVLSRWLINKTPEIITAWIASPADTLLVAVEGDSILGAGSVRNTGEITLNYVSPDARFRGVSRAMIGALEDAAMKRGNARCFLTSTETAHRFYLSVGYRDEGPPIGKFGSAGGYPMAKTLAQPMTDG